MFAKGVHSMKTKWRHGLVCLWLAGTLVLLLGTGLTLRPDRDAAQYFKHQHIESVESDVQVRQLLTHIRFLQGKGLTLEQIKSELLSSGSLTNEALSKVVELNAALGVREHAKERLALFASVALLPPLLILELGAVLFWARRGFKAWMDASRNGSHHRHLGAKVRFRLSDHECLLLATSRHTEGSSRTSALPPKADVNGQGAGGPLVTQSRHAAGQGGSRGMTCRRRTFLHRMS